MNPVAINLGFWQIYWYSILLALGFIIGYLIFIKFGKEKGLKKHILEKYFIWCVVSIVVGARLFEVFFYNFQYYLNDPIKIFYIWQGGISSHGAIIGLIIMTLVFAKRNKLRFYQLSDLVVIPAALGAAFVRIGNFINGELVGRVTTSALGVGVKGAMRHPVQLYQSFSNFVLFGVLYSIRGYKEGVLTWGFIGLYSIFRFFTEFYKDLPYGNWPINLAQVLSIIGVGVSGYFLYRILSTR